MSRTGPEPKPPWRAVPEAVRLEVGRRLGSPVARGVRVWGGYGPTPTYRLLLRDGRRAFFKGCGPDASEFHHAAYTYEIRVYEEIGHLIGDCAPRCYGSIRAEGWHVLLLEDLGPRSVPPWTAGRARRIVQAFARWHRESPTEGVPGWVPRPEVWLDDPGPPWGWARDDEDIASRVALAGERAGEAAGWVARTGGTLAGTSRRLLEPGGARLLHGDARSDNLRWLGGRLLLLDWPAVRVGPPEYDVVLFLQSITAEGGPPPERLLSWYEEVTPLDAGRLDAAACAVAGFFADQAWRGELPGLPRLRAFQRAQLVVSLRWAARRLGLPEPGWLDGVAAAAG